MHWYHLVAYFFAGSFFVNAIPHFVHGVSGAPFQTPFAKPPGKGLSSATVNILWSCFNLLLAYGLLCRVGAFQLRSNAHAISFAMGFLLTALMLARTFGPLHGGDLKSRP